KELGKEPLRLVDRLLEALASGESGERLRADPDLLAVDGTPAGARLALARQERAEADHGDALAFGDVLDDRIEHGVHRFARHGPAQVSRLRCDLDEIRLRDDVSHRLLSPCFAFGLSHRIQTKMERQWNSRNARRPKHL